MSIFDRARTPLRQTLLLAFIILLAIVARAVGLGQGLPFDYHWDERIYFHESLFALANGLRRESTVSADLPYLMLPLLLAQWLWLWISGQAAFFADFVRVYIENPGPFVLLGRIFWAASGVLSVVWVYKLGKRLADARVGLMAAFFLAGAFLHVEESHFIKNDVPAGLLLLLATERCLDILERGERRDYLWAGVWVGAAAATKYYAAVAFLVIIFAFLLQRSRRSGPTSVGDLAPAKPRFSTGAWPLLLAALGSVIAFTICMPALVVDPANLWGNLSYEFGAQFGSIPTGDTPQWLFYLAEHLDKGMGNLLLLAGLVGLVMMVMRRQTPQVLFVAMPVLFFIAVNTRPNNFARYMIPAVPFLCIAAALTLRATVGQFVSITLMRFRAMASLEHPLARRLTSGATLRYVTPVALTIGALILGAESWTNTVRYDYYALAPDTRTAAQNWIETNVAQGASMVIEGGESFNRTSNLGPQVRPTLAQLQAWGPNSATEAFYWRELLATSPHHPAYSLNMVGSVGYSPQQINGKRVNAPVASTAFWNNPDYFVLISWRSNDLRPGSTAAFWSSLNANYNLTATFPCAPCFPEDYYAWRIDYDTLSSVQIGSPVTGGPEVRIFKRKSAAGGGQ